MDHNRKALQWGAMAIAFAIFLRLLSFGITAARDIFQGTEWLSVAVFLQTGRIVRFPKAEAEEPEPIQTQPTRPEAPTLPPVELPAFSADDLLQVGLINDSGYGVQLETLLQAPLQWDLTDGEPAVLILHTHGSEAYTISPGAVYEPCEDYRTMDIHYNMVSIGQEVARILEAGGISVIHDQTLHDQPNYNTSYANARETIRRYLEQYPSIRMVLDIHRDAANLSSGNQLTTSATVGGQASSQIMLVIGTDATGNYHPNWRENLALAVKLSAQLEREAPGITRPIHLRPERFNMDMTPGSLLVEVGAAGDTHEAAMLAANALARAILALARGVSE